MTDNLETRKTCSWIYALTSPLSAVMERIRHIESLAIQIWNFENPYYCTNVDRLFYLLHH